MVATSRIKFGDNLLVTDEGAGTIRVDASGGGSGGGALEWEDVGTSGVSLLRSEWKTVDQAQPVPVGSSMNIVWEVKDDAVLQITAGNPSRVTIKEAAWYLVTGHVNALNIPAGKGIKVLTTLQGAAGGTNGLSVTNYGGTVAIATISWQGQINAGGFVDVTCSHGESVAATVNGWFRISQLAKP
jgi:hypothetical protein